MESQLGGRTRAHQLRNLTEVHHVLSEVVERLDQGSMQVNMPRGQSAPQIQRPLSCGSETRSFQSQLYNAVRQQTRRRSCKKRKIAMWNHDIICLARNDQDKPPSPMERAKLMLGLKKIDLF